ncbi:hypothetical protein PORCRE_488 [Porphyromonas crevioricanis JCM 15906]|uniref:Uncharacterized protein n=1 Tax=Porphyromonas crevioricanis JCM 15906 TaxID=1305617 RepID=T1CM82_9PORP|nr:hypothetical protein PORCRE_488 [Porphyromonas crevioricanis JCM 15906]
MKKRRGTEDFAKSSREKRATKRKRVAQDNQSCATFLLHLRCFCLLRFVSKERKDKIL